METKTEIPNPYQGLDREQSLEKMRQLAAEETRSQVLMGLLYNYLVDSKLLKGSQYKSALDFICSNIQQISRSSLLLYSAVARAFTQEVCSRFGVYRLSALLTYKEAAKIELNTAEPGGTFILVPDEKGVVKPKLFSACTVEELRSAVQHVRQQASNHPIPAEQRELVDQYREAVVRRFPRGRGGPGAAAHPQGEHGGGLQGHPGVQGGQADRGAPGQPLPRARGARGGGSPAGLVSAPASLSAPRS